MSEDHLGPSEQVATARIVPVGDRFRVEDHGDVADPIERVLVEHVERRVMGDQQRWSVVAHLHTHAVCTPMAIVNEMDRWDRVRANPLALGPLLTRDDVARAVVDLYEPLRPYVSPGGARVRLGSFASVFEQSTAELEGFARPLYGIVPLTVGGYDFAHWDRVVDGLDAGTDPDSAEYWGPVPGDNDQRMVEQAAIGLALAFCPERTWEPLSADARERLVTWLQGIFDHDPNPNNWQFFRVLVALGLERVGAPFDSAKVNASLDLLDSYLALADSLWIAYVLASANALQSADVAAQPVAG